MEQDVENKYGDSKARRLGFAALKPCGWGKKNKRSKRGVKIHVLLGARLCWWVCICHHVERLPCLHI
jgi:hypothetical protein